VSGMGGSLAGQYRVVYAIATTKKDQVAVLMLERALPQEMGDFDWREVSLTT